MNSQRDFFDFLTTWNGFHFFLVHSMASVDESTFQYWTFFSKLRKQYTHYTHESIQINASRCFAMLLIQNFKLSRHSDTNSCCFPFNKYIIVCSNEINLYKIGLVQFHKSSKYNILSSITNSLMFLHAWPYNMNSLWCLLSQHFHVIKMRLILFSPKILSNIQLCDLSSFLMSYCAWCIIPARLRTNQSVENPSRNNINL